MAFELITAFSYIAAVSINICWIIGSLRDLGHILASLGSWLVCIIILANISLIVFIGLIGRIGFGLKIISSKKGSWFYANY